MSSPERLPASIYRRRRLGVGLALLAIILIIVLLIIRPGSGNTPTSAPSPTATSSITARPIASPCSPEAISLTPIADKGEYQPGETPLVSMSILNTGSTACTLNVGTDAQLYEIVSGQDPIWNSRDCQITSDPLERILEPGSTLTTDPFPWDRTRSAPDTCALERPAVVAGGATYRLSVSLGAIKSESDAPFLLY